MTGCSPELKDSFTQMVLEAWSKCIHGVRTEKQLKDYLHAQYGNTTIKCPWALSVEVRGDPPIYDGVNFSIGGKTYGEHVRVTLKVVHPDRHFPISQKCVLDAVFEPANDSGKLFKVIVKRRDSGKTMLCGPINFNPEGIFKGFFRSWLDGVEAEMKKACQKNEECKKQGKQSKPQGKVGSSLISYRIWQKVT